MKYTKVSTISKSYAKALLDVANESILSEKFRTQLDEILQVLSTSEDLRIVMANTSISIAEKLEIIDAVFADKIDKKLLNFLKILVEKGRFNELEAINLAYIEMVENLSNIKTVEISSPIALNFENKSNVLFKLEHKLKCEIRPIWKIDESLIAGLRFKIDDCTIDTSVRAKLEDLSKKIVR